jgi:hypothetical protein
VTLQKNGVKQTKIYFLAMYKAKPSTFYALVFLSCGVLASCVASADTDSKAIATVVQRGSTIYAYNDNGAIITTISGGNGPKDGITGYTSNTISMRRGSTIYLYNLKGSLISTISAGN